MLIVKVVGWSVNNPVTSGYVHHRVIVIAELCQTDEMFSMGSSTLSSDTSRLDAESRHDSVQLPTCSVCSMSA